MADAVIYAGRGGKIALWNRAAAALFGYEAAEALGSSIDIIVPERLREPHWRGFEAAMASGTLKLSGRPTLTRALHKDGSRLYIEMSFALVKNAGSPVDSVAVARVAAPPRGALAVDAEIDRTCVGRQERNLENPTVGVLEGVAKALTCARVRALGLYKFTKRLAPRGV